MTPSTKLLNVTESPGNFIYNKCQEEWLLPAPTIKQVTEVQHLEELPLPHEALQRAGPALSQDLDPLKVQL